MTSGLRKVSKQHFHSPYENLTIGHLPRGCISNSVSWSHGGMALIAKQHTHYNTIENL